MRRLRYIPPGGALVEVTTRTQQGRFLLRPSPEFNQIATGVLARALKQAEVRFHGIVCLSSHYHALIWAQDAQQLAKFMTYLNGMLGRLVAVHRDWSDKVWSRRYQAIVISNEPNAQEARLRYLLEHGSKENLMVSPRDWPGLHLAKNIVNGEALRGYWINRTKLSAAEAAARRSGEKVNPMDFATWYEVETEPLPGWSDRPYEEYRQYVTDLVHQIEAETSKRRRKEQEAYERQREELRRKEKSFALLIKPCILGLRRILAADPHHRPKSLKRSQAPAFHTATKKAYKELRDAYAWFVAAYRQAADQLKSGDRNAVFPEGSFPPALPFEPG